MSFSISQNKLMETRATLRDLVDQAVKRREEEKRMRDQAARDRFGRFPFKDIMRLLSNSDDDNSTSDEVLMRHRFPPTDRSDFNHEEFADEHAQIISPPEYDRFCFKIEPELGNLTMDVVNDIFPIREPRVHVPNVLPPIPSG
ncbi:hypothetical protein Tco_0789033 [Tanacetum coccineum]